ncbi:sugar ABC transporter ATP-binding protein [Pantoea ananatis]|jgi:ABC-2 type transport system ATP-binding protein/lipopolysaccharide transport system ATP-binding protein|uniref:KpsT protein, ABC-type polysaccharide/polyol phosphate transport system, ATPase component [carbohydrate transport and metabolism / cell envelope biogenesis, outer membrane] n=1 Tax=Pantoea ananatis (strain AJ13355) TaxID=932677 RepID=A0A0H3KXQ7_PANAA|nr:ABC transporter ATP-binding protein [Pantoea ananatis]ASN14634.1 sugar ABC transporter ATP-binding protein [Pantoea ananatis]MCV3298977.1 ABC transporter ATP-binding protein [Pantoea ananatis]MCW0310819.1 Teichoic acids export ATP-binding protein TagH [Pantoea ananatis]MCW0351358.1 Teichoic acids export ATP-binding protein TagH [Pantoea ananatis]MDC7867244.1 sugar ABC transporter ATP-binding protein [Pantoea ananatis]
MSSYLKLDNVAVSYPIFDVKSRSLKANFVRLTTGGVISSNSRQVTVDALKNINLKLEHGDRLALIGHNGAGKSTLLKTMAGIYEPTQGEIESKGSIASLLDINLGVNPESSGRENIYSRGMLLGMSKRQINETIDEIIDFTDLADFIDLPVRTYSSGMSVRLAFAISTAVKPDILLLDEVIGAGDANFMDKARKRILNLIESVGILVFSSHSEADVKSFCTKGVVLDAGKIVFNGSVDDAYDFYAHSRVTS